MWSHLSLDHLILHLEPPAGPGASQWGGLPSLLSGSARPCGPLNEDIFSDHLSMVHNEVTVSSVTFIYGNIKGKGVNLRSNLDDVFYECSLKPIFKSQKPYIKDHQQAKNIYIITFKSRVQMVLKSFLNFFKAALKLFKWQSKIWPKCKKKPKLPNLATVNFLMRRTHTQWFKTIPHLVE